MLNIDQFRKRVHSWCVEGIAKEIRILSDETVSLLEIIAIAKKL